MRKLLIEVWPILAGGIIGGVLGSVIFTCFSPKFKNQDKSVQCKLTNPKFNVGSIVKTNKSWRDMLHKEQIKGKVVKLKFDSSVEILPMAILDNGAEVSCFWLEEDLTPDRFLEK